MTITCLTSFSGGLLVLPGYEALEEATLNLLYYKEYDFYTLLHGFLIRRTATSRKLRRFTANFECVDFCGGRIQPPNDPPPGCVISRGVLEKLERHLKQASGRDDVQLCVKRGTATEEPRMLRRLALCPGFDKDCE